jgi:hypothetical protein
MQDKQSTPAPSGGRSLTRGWPEIGAGGLGEQGGAAFDAGAPAGEHGRGNGMVCAEKRGLKFGGWYRDGFGGVGIRERVIAARQRQQARFAGKPKISCNARMGSWLGQKASSAVVGREAAAEGRVARDRGMRRRPMVLLLYRLNLQLVRRGFKKGSEKNSCSERGNLKPIANGCVVKPGH